MDLHEPEQRHEVETALEEVKGVVSVRLVPGYERSVDEAHVLIDVDRDPKLVVRDLQSLLMARFDVTTDHRVFSIVQLGEDDVRRRATPRLVLTQTAVVSRGGTVEIEVQVTDEEGNVITGSAVGGPGERSRGRTAGQATLRAVAAATGEDVGAHLEGVVIQELFGTQVVITVVQLRQTSGTQVLTGSAPVRSEEVDAVVRATMDAVNRVLALEFQ